MPNAARLADPVGHSPTMSWLLYGLLLGAGVGLAFVAVVGTGGLAAAAIIGGLAAGGAGIFEVASTMSWAPKDITGVIAPPCSSNVFTNSRPAARAHIDKAFCSPHMPPPPPIATGSDSVYINSMPAARVGDKIACSAVIVEGSPNVFIGGGTTQTDVIHPEELVPAWVHTTLLVVGLASAVILAGPVMAIGGMAGGMLGGAGGERLGAAIFGEGSDGQKWMMLGGSFLGGAAGMKGAPKAWSFAKRVQITTEPGTLGMSGGNIKVGLKPLSPHHETTPMLRYFESEHLPGNKVWPGRQVKYLSDAERAETAIQFKDGKVYDSRGKLFDTEDGVKGRAIFVMDEAGNFYAYKYPKAGAFHHSSFLGGKPVAAAGEIEVIAGEITGISDKSGHYTPAAKFLNQAMKKFESLGIDTRYIFNF